jgi:hypothetical protein
MRMPSGCQLARQRGQFARDGGRTVRRGAALVPGDDQVAAAHGLVERGGLPETLGGKRGKVEMGAGALQLLLVEEGAQAGRVVREAAEFAGEFHALETHRRQCGERAFEVLFDVVLDGPQLHADARRGCRGLGQRRGIDKGEQDGCEPWEGHGVSPDIFSKCKITHHLPIKHAMSLDTSTTLRHVVLFAFKDSATVEQIDTVIADFGLLKERIPGIIAYEWGTNVSPEGLNQGLHPLLHAELRQRRGPQRLPAACGAPGLRRYAGRLLEKSLVVDYWAQ